MPCPIGSKPIRREVRGLLIPLTKRSPKPSSAPTVRTSFTGTAPSAVNDVNVFLYDGAIVPDPEGIITGGQKTARTVSIRQGEPINAPALTAMFKQIIANNRAGGWRSRSAKDSLPASRAIRPEQLRGFRAPVARSEARADDDQIFLLEASTVPGTEVPLVAEAIERVIHLCFFPVAHSRIVARGDRRPVLRLEVLAVVDARRR